MLELLVWFDKSSADEYAYGEDLLLKLMYDEKMTFAFFGH